MKTKFNGILTLLLALIVQFSFAQDRTISGIVSDESGPLPGVTVLKKGTTQGTETDFDGKYTIKSKTGEILVFNFVGMKTTQKTVGTSNQINIVMENDNVLDEIVVVAYGSQSRNSLTGSVSVVDKEQVENATFSNPVKSLEGLVSGLRVIQASGQPGSNPIIRIRGFGSINADSAPLIVLDGVPYSGSLSSINPKDIESTSVLKDASSTSLYGNKASNGVLLITTKKGAVNQTRISIDSKVGVTQRGSKEYNIIKTPGEFYETYHSILANSEFYKQNTAKTPITMSEASKFASNNLIERVGNYNLYNVPGNQLVDPITGKLNSSANLLVNDKWEDALFRDAAIFHSNNFSLSGGSEDITYYLSLGTETNNGYTVRSSFKRNTARLKASSSKIYDVLTISGDVSYANSKSQAVPSTFNANGNPSTNFSNAFFWTRRIAPIYPVYQYDANWNPILNPNNPNGLAYDFGAPQFFPNGKARGARGYAVGEHPLAVIENTTEENVRDNFNGGLRAKLDLPLEFQFEYVMNYLAQVDKGTDFTKPGAGAFALAQNGLLTNNRDNFSAFTNQQLLTWKKEEDNHSFNVLLGHETYEENFTTLSLSKRNLIGDLSPVLDNTSVYASASNYNTNYTTEGYFSRFIYGLNNTYYLNLTGRYDASSVFHPDERWGSFWSVGTSWIMSNEDFMDSKVINYAKLSINYGTTGNDRIFYSGTTTRNFVAYENQYEVDENNGALTQNLLYLGNKKLTWEKSASLDVSYEVSLFNSLNLSLGYYRKKSNDLLFNTPLPISTGQASRPQNAGSMVNSGFETEISWNAVKKENININFNANLSTLNNEITTLPNNDEPIQSGNFRREVGKSIFDYYMRKSAGVNTSNGNAQWYKKDETTGQDVITEEYSEADRYFIDKQAIPDITGGFGTSVKIHDFSLGLQFAYQLGGYGLDNEYFGLLRANKNITNLVDYNKTWTVDNPTASLPRVDPLSNNQYSVSDLYLVDLSYLSLSNINVAYVLKNEAFKKHHIDNVKFYGTINNAFLLYNARQGYDPRLNSVGASSAEYGANRTIAFGVNINLN
ncbi:SusC/RagA family TonB-linked outer membrane protein [Tenacibaculum finnmarkense]|uniref:SusC/RagA family TonB-linked outer membrane protein n=1 Tax=Tenacibaculum finnmarkense TaxID=2781243 RepID=UPI00187B5320|nr:SusC/RagA family TonB-linked outer membrane protein [Tenacibaculum finnmarkense]MBE7648978.1 SusC/RagA family TonB-linked outer membrane protein [Tenacibaculum finnmarkense genomovar ulcerans]MBE7688860.1 SusC/RagA family TonB-linked outer membrane protein [Tenacibaculum finnmarkense genomovar ulcerans]MCD8410644.1 SusC/RagA family TonB-linked outer membrane protein [Tenacibaculum finnmarkense genomovar ulcerans]MCG8750265.1 SusC/RagA family TonB-linked outer membrane protein [Tenacibaculum 